MKILITNDCDGWAIGNLTDAIIKGNSRFTFVKVPVHPRGVTESLIALKQALDDGIDFWHAQYWNSAYKMLNDLPPSIANRLREVPSLLTHHNHHCLRKEDWKKLGFDSLNEMTKWGVDILREKHDHVYKIPHGIDLDRFEYIPKLTEEKNVGYIGRVVPWKHLKEVIQAATGHGYKVVGSGYVDDVAYWNEINKSNLIFNGGVGRIAMASANSKDAIYEKMMCFVMYSTGEKESGTLPLLEAMSRGVPILATEQGMARDIIKDGGNGLFFNEDNFADKLHTLMEDKKLREKLRKNAWETIKSYSEAKMARDYGKVYYKTAFPNDPLISVIIPTFDRADKLWDIIESIDKQDYLAKEIIIIDDGSTDPKVKQVVNLAKKNIKTNILYLNTGNNKKHYGLAQARNMGAIEAMGDVLLFLDDRYTLNKGCLEEISKHNDRDTWYFGEKIIKGNPGNKSSFIENFSWILKKDFFKGGMFNERLTMYGGLSQETRQRFGYLNYDFQKISKAIVTEIISTRKGKKKDQVWKAKFLISKMYE